MSETATLNNQAEIFARAIEGQRGRLSADVAGFLVSLDLALEDRGRRDALAELAPQGDFRPMRRRSWKSSGGAVG